jgi:hypothetical protein
MPGRSYTKPHVVDVLGHQDPDTDPQEEVEDGSEAQKDDARQAEQAEVEAQLAELDQIQQMENELALRKGRLDPTPELEGAVPRQRDNIVLHFVGDGFTALGSVWYRGQELEFTPGTRAYQDTCDRNGVSWTELRRDEDAQIERFGQVLFRDGPWPGKGVEAIAEARYESLRATDGRTSATRPSDAEVARAVTAEKRRGRAAPRLV